MNGKPKVIVLCGSSRYVDIMAVCAWILERDEYAVTMSLHLLPSWYGDGVGYRIPDHLAEKEGVADELDERHLRKIDMADEIFVVNYNYYVGESTRTEVEYAIKHGKKVRWFTDDPVGAAVLGIMLKAHQHLQTRKEKRWSQKKSRKK